MANAEDFKRRQTVTVNIGKVPLGSDYPVRVQSMANVPVSDLKGSVDQCIRIFEAGAGYVRFTVPSLMDARRMGNIKEELRRRGYDIPLIADVHFNAEVAMQVAAHVEKIRINPGNFVDTRKFQTIGPTEEEDQQEIRKIREKLLPLIEKCRTYGVALRIGVNHGSLADRIMRRHGDTPEGMAESAMEFLRICRDEHFDQVVVSMKASHVKVMIQATRLVVKMMDGEHMRFPLHLGVTEAGEGEDGRIKSAAGLGALLADGLGDTIRVSLTEDPEDEIPVAQCLVDHFNLKPGQEVLPAFFHSGPVIYRDSLRITRTAGNMGGNRVPVVVGEVITAADATVKTKGQQPEYFFCRSGAEMISLDDGNSYIIPFDLWPKPGYLQLFPLMTKEQYLRNTRRSDKLNFVEVTGDDLEDKLTDALTRDPSAVLVYRCTLARVQYELRMLRMYLEERSCDIPVIIRQEYREELQNFMIKAAADLGGTFMEGFGNGIWLSDRFPNSADAVVSVAFGILQACRVRITKTEFISCPSCGRTNFNLMDTLARIKEATSHLKGLKIGVMGCIVNGPGEMADADYGYVGAGKGRITLYKAKQVVARGIPEDRAVEHLVNLIKASGDWVEP